MLTIRLIKNIATLVVIAYSQFCLIGCGTNSICDQNEVFRISSPDNKVDAVLIRTNCGSTTSYSYNLFVTKKGDSVKAYNAIFVADHLEGEVIKWISSGNLLITYTHARIFNFTNFWQSREVDNFNYVVTISEMPIRQ